MIEFKRNKATGILEVWKNKKKIGKIITMGDDINERNNRSENHR